MSERSDVVVVGGGVIGVCVARALAARGHVRAATLTGRLVAEVCAGEAPSLDIAALAPTRFGA